ncbi:MAG: RHS repeat-associated core domain-containing protein [Rhodothermales bacterium]
MMHSHTTRPTFRIRLLLLIGLLLCVSSTRTASGTDAAISLEAAPLTYFTGVEFVIVVTIDNTSTFGGGPLNTTNMRTLLTIPNGVSYLRVSGDEQVSCVQTGTTIDCNYASFSAGAVRMFNVHLQGDAVGTYEFPATLSHDQFDPNSGNNTSQVVIQITEAPEPGLSLVKSVSDSEITQDNMTTFTLTVSNPGTSAISDVQVQDGLPAGLDFVEFLFGATNDCVHSLGVVTCTTPTIGPGESFIWEFRVRATGAGEITNTAQATSAEIPGPVTDSAVVTVKTVADVSVSKVMAAPTILENGAQIFTITVTNNGPQEARNVVATDELPVDPANGFPIFNDAVLTGDCSGQQLVRCNAGTLAPGQTKTFVIGASVNGSELFGDDPLLRAQAVEYTNTATVTSDTEDPAMTNNESSVTGAVIKLPGSGANTPGSESVSDPVNTFNGELHDRFEPDLHLNGPTPLSFVRYYGAFMDATGLVESGLGPNWSHSWAWRLVAGPDVGDDFVQVVSPEGRLFAFRDTSATGTGILTQVTALDAPMQLRVEGSSYLFADPRSGVVRTFDAEGRFTRLRTRSGHVVSLSWSGQELQAIDDGAGRVLEFNWAAGRMASVSGGTRTVSFTYDGNGWLSGVVHADGTMSTMEYAAGRSAPLMTALVGPDGHARFMQEFDERGRVTRQTDALGGVTSLSYTSENVTTVTNPAGEVEIYTYNENGSLGSVQDAFGTVEFGYDATGRRTSVTDRLGSETRIEYHTESGLPTRFINADGTAATAAYTPRMDEDDFMVYDLSSRTAPGGTQVDYVVDSNGNRVSKTSPTGQTRTFSHNAFGQVTSMSVPGKGTTTFTYDSSGLLTTTVGPDGKATTYTWDNDGRLTGFSNAAGETRSYAYDEMDRLIRTTFEDGTSRSYTWDAVGRLTSITNEAGRTSTLTYDDQDQLTSQTDYAGNTVVFTYDVVGRMTSRTDRTDRTTTWTYDAQGNILSETTPGGDVTMYSWNAEGILTGMNDPEGGSVSVTTDAMGRITGIQNSDGAETSMMLNARGLATQITGPDGTSAQLTHDAAGRTVSYSHPGGSASYSHNATGEPVSVTTPLGDAYSFTTDARGRVTSFTNPLGQTRSFAFDDAGRATEATMPDGTRIAYGYDARGRLVSLASGNAQHTYTYDVTGRLLTTEGLTLARDANGRITASNSLAVERDAEGRILRLTLPAGDVEYGYNANGRVANVTDWAGRVTTFEYDATGRMTRISRPNGVRTGHVYSNGGHLTELWHTRESNEVVAGVEVTRSAAGLPLEAEYQAMLAPELTPGSVSRTHNAAFQIEDFTFDAQGRRTADDLRSYDWDGLSRLARAGDILMDHDGMGMVTTVGAAGASGDAAWQWNYATAVPTATVQSKDAQHVAFYVYTPAGELLYRVDAATGAANFYLYDEQGNTRLVTNDDGDMVAAWAYGPFGEPLGTWGQTEGHPFTWRGQEGVMDLGDGLYYMRQRVYDSESAQFLSPDPVLTFDPLHLNPYQYAALNPTAFTDPLGQREKALQQLVGVLGILVTDLETLADEAAGGIKTPGLSKINEKLGSLTFGSFTGSKIGGAALKGGSLAPNASGLISAGLETYQSGNVARGLGVGAVDIALTANPYVAAIVIASDLTDAGLSLAGIPPPELGNIFRNAGRAAGGLVTDVVLSPISSDHDFGDSLAGVADSFDDQGGVTGVIFDTGAQIMIFFGNEDLGDYYEAKDAAAELDIEVKAQIDAQQRSMRRTVQKWLPGYKGL